MPLLQSAVVTISSIPRLRYWCAGSSVVHTHGEHPLWEHGTAPALQELPAVSLQ